MAESGLELLGNVEDQKRGVGCRLSQPDWAGLLDPDPE